MKILCVPYGEQRYNDGFISEMSINIPQSYWRCKLLKKLFYYSIINDLLSYCPTHKNLLFKGKT